MKFAEMIREHMKQSGDSFSKVARKVGVSKATVAHWVSGDRTPSKLSVRKVCRGLGWDIETEAILLGMSDGPKRNIGANPEFKRDKLTDEFWRLVRDIELTVPDGLKGVPEDDERLMRIREIVGAARKKQTTIYDKQKVEKLRIKHGYSGNHMSELMGYGRSWYNGTFKKNERFPDFHARKLAEIFGVSVNDLVREDD